MAVSCVEGEQCRGQDTSLRCPGVCCSCAGDGFAHPHPLCSARKKAEQPFDQCWVNRHGQEFLDHEMWLDGVECAAEVHEEDSCVRLLPVMVFIQVMEKGQYGILGVPILFVCKL